MKKRTKAWLITGLLLILAGAALCAGVLALNHWDLAALFTTELETRAVELREEIHSIAVTADTERLSLLPSDDGSCRVIFEEGEKQLLVETISRPAQKRIEQIAGPAVLHEQTQGESAPRAYEAAAGGIAVFGAAVLQNDLV